MRNLKIAGAALLLGSSTFALAQSDDPTEEDSFGTEVSTHAQENAREGGIGEWVSERAKARAGERDETDDDETDVDDDETDVDDPEDGESQGIGTAVSEAARTAAQDENREGGVAEAVLPHTRASDRALEAVQNAGTAADAARQNAGSARDNAGAARDNATAARDNATAARDNASAARETAMSARDNARNARDNARDARGRGRGGG